jgi:hypothetical protein
MKKNVQSVINTDPLVPTYNPPPQLMFSISENILPSISTIADALIYIAPPSTVVEVLPPLKPIPVEKFVLCTITFVFAPPVTVITTPVAVAEDVVIPENELSLISKFTVFAAVTPASDSTTPLFPVVVKLLKLHPRIVTPLDPATLISEIVELPPNAIFVTFTEERTKLLPPVNVANEYIVGDDEVSFVI